MTLVVGLAAGMSATPALAFEASVAMSPSTIAYYGAKDPRTTRSVEYRLHVTAGSQEERVIISESYPGSSLDAAVVHGAGSLRVLNMHLLVGDDFGSPGRDACPAQASFSSFVRRELVLAAGSATTIVFKRRLDIGRAPRDARQYVKSFDLTAAPAADLSAGLPGTMTVSSPLPVLAGLTSAKLVLRAGLSGSGADNSIGSRQGLAVRPRSAMTISGFLSPGRRGDPITIWTYEPGSRRPAKLAVVRADSYGRFLYRRWRPAAHGVWELYATWPGLRDRVQSARSDCGGPQIKVTNIVGDGKPEGPLSTVRYPEP